MCPEGTQIHSYTHMIKLRILFLGPLRNLSILTKRHEPVESRYAFSVIHQWNIFQISTHPWNLLLQVPEKSLLSLDALMDMGKVCFFQDSSVEYLPILDPPMEFRASSPRESLSSLDTLMDISFHKLIKALFTY